MLTVGDTLTADVHALAYGGDGVARCDGRVLFIPESAPGDRLRVRVTQVKKRYARAIGLDLITPSPQRLAPCCRIIDPDSGELARVPGCCYDHLAYPAEVAAKQQQLEGLLRHLPGVWTADWATKPDGSRDFAMAMQRLEDALQSKQALSPDRRGARFVSVICLAWPDGHAEYFRGEVEGMLVWPPRGDKGFGRALVKGTKFGMDTRGLRFPGLISYEALPGGGTTDYAVHIYYDAIKKGSYTSFIAQGTYMDMMYMPDALNAIVRLMEADPARLLHRNAFNISAMSFEPEQIAASIRKFMPGFTMDYDVDPLRQGIAESWPDSLDCSAAREEWGFAPEYDLDRMSEDMLARLKEKL